MPLVPKGRLYFFTGKGGVGKTLAALSLAHHLRQKNKNILFMDTRAPENKEHTLCQRLHLTYKPINVLASLEEYARFKFHSRTLAKWITRLEFTASLMNIVPGIGHIVYLGYISHLLKKDPALTIVLDAPSSGHMATMLGSLETYHQIFRSGTIFNDIKAINDFILSPKNVAVFICHLPTQLSLTEGCELKDRLENLSLNNIHMVLNAALSLALHHLSEELPPYLSERLRLETQALNQFPYPWIAKIPYLTSLDDLEKIKEMSLCWEGVIT